MPVIRRAVEQTRQGAPALLEFITEKAEDFSRYCVGQVETRLRLLGDHAV